MLYVDVMNALLPSTQVMASVFGESPFDLAHYVGGTGHGESGSDAIFHCADAFVTVVAVDDTNGSPVQVGSRAVAGGCFVGSGGLWVWAQATHRTPPPQPACPMMRHKLSVCT